MSELPADLPAPPVDVTALARPLGLLVPVRFDAGLWAFCQGGGADAGVALDAERVARYLLAGLVRALRRVDGAVPDLLPYRMALGTLELDLMARIDAQGITLAPSGRGARHLSRPASS